MYIRAQVSIYHHIQERRKAANGSQNVRQSSSRPEKKKNKSFLFYFFFFCLSVSLLRNFHDLFGNKENDNREMRET
jgi:hypothetical protein